MSFITVKFGGKFADSTDELPDFHFSTIERLAESLEYE